MGTIKSRVTRDRPQGGVVFTLIWNIVINNPHFVQPTVHYSPQDMLTKLQYC